MKKSKPIKKEHLKKDAKSFKEIGEETKDIQSELKKLKSRDVKEKKSSGRPTVRGKYS